MTANVNTTPQSKFNYPNLQLAIQSKCLATANFPLMFAMETRKAQQIIQLLLDAKANANDRTMKFACSSGKSSLIPLLLAEFKQAQIRVLSNIIPQIPKDILEHHILPFLKV